ncbi:uncharacterized protein LOC110848803 [Folsomia candida]|uniref:Chitin-binding type-4 domain-containing protein n=1 Tax=Folsomia candida TaxID=158441 RepID=A0A226EFH3_FOLCA|nr:uncharacterized protein LOC110848803 [Folsomia candida]XP_021951817.1 uncharacterized protein LOC110848803 [Folsomia candida]OXA56335.1 hypothetical protein Fcan01_08629 [Folsomia candida]
MGNFHPFSLYLVVVTLLVAFHSGDRLVSGHGRMMEPPNRSSIWRRVEYEELHPPINYNDNELFCGGFIIQYEHNDGKCGECGDSFNSTKPRENEHGGFYGKGIITKTYTRGQEIVILVELTFGHMGYFEFRVCNLDNDQSESEACFEQNLLQLSNGSPTIPTRYPIPTSGVGWYNIKASLPTNLVCFHCVLQWHYYAGNSWGECEDGTYAIGCGPQETFRGCADIAIIN